MVREVWAPVPFDPRYEVSSLGRVRGGATGTMKKITVRPDGYHCVGFYYGPGKTRTRLLHRLVLLAFIGEPPSGDCQAAHWDGDKANNELSNLRWASPSENNLDKKRHGTFTNPRKLGAANHKSKLTAAKVRLVRAAYDSGGSTISDLAREHGISTTAMSAVVKRKHWAHV